VPAPSWTADELGQCTSIERFFGRIFSLFSPFRLQRPPPSVGRRSRRASPSRMRRPSSWTTPLSRPDMSCSHPLPSPRPRSHLGRGAPLSSAAPS
jgi:hypothetical protein